MHIKDTPSIRAQKKSTTNSVALKKDAPSVFAATLSSKQGYQSDYDEEIDELRQEIELAGEKLEKEPILSNFRQYRELLSKLAKLINAEAYQLEKVGGTPHNPRYYEIITVINKEADQLYNLIVQENRNSMAITAKVIGIKGLVVDLVT